MSWNLTKPAPKVPFNVPIGRFKELCRMMIRNNFDFQWFTFFRCSAARDTEIYDLMQASGCRATDRGAG